MYNVLINLVNDTMLNDLVYLNLNEINSLKKPFRTVLPAEVPVFQKHTLYMAIYVLYAVNYERNCYIAVSKWRYPTVVYTDLALYRR